MATCSKRIVGACAYCTCQNDKRIDIMKRHFFTWAVLACAVCALYAQDPRERHYFYEILDPKHEPKPLVEGFAQQRITEQLNRGLVAVPARDG